jgi:hypothetical protein
MEIKKKYEEMRHKHDLPDFKLLNSDFEVSKIEELEFLPRELRRAMIDKIDTFIGTLHEIIQPDTNAASMYEVRIFEESEKTKIFEIFRKLMYYKRYSMELEVICDEKADYRFINDLFKEWQFIKPDVLKLARKLKLSWKNLDDEELKMEYFG